MVMPLLKYLQAQGLGSRKQCMELIHAGEVEINGCLADDPKAPVAENVAALAIGGIERQPVPVPFFYIILNKPEGYETSHKPQFWPPVFSLLPEPLRHADIQAVGRLDADTTGILILTNDGRYNHRLCSPKHKVPKIYRVTLKHPVSEAFCKALTMGVRLHDSDETAVAEDVCIADEHTILLTITSGRYHQVKRMVSAAGNRVEALHRTDFGGLSADDLPAGGWRFFTPDF